MNPPAVLWERIPATTKTSTIGNGSPGSEPFRERLAMTIECGQKVWVALRDEKVAPVTTILHRCAEAGIR